MVSVVVCTKGRFHDLRDCLSALKDQSYRDFEVIIVDGNGDTDVRDLARLLGCTYVDQTKERGIMNTPASRNLGIKHARGEILAFIDDDAIPSKDWLSHLVRHYLEGNLAGVGGPVITSTCSKRATASMYNNSYVYAAYKVLLNEDTRSFGRVLPSGLVTENWGAAIAGVHKVEGLIGTNMSFRKSWFYRVGNFDEFISSYGLRDETDFCLRIVENGGTLVLDSEAIVFHKLSPKKTSSIRLYYSYYTDFYFLMKHKNFFALPKLLVRETLTLSYLTLRSLSNFKGDGGWNYALRGRIDAYRDFGFGGASFNYSGAALAVGRIKS